MGKISSSVSVCVFLFFLSAARSHGDIIVSIEISGSEFDIFLSDNDVGATFGTFGIASYGVPLLGDVLTLDHKSPSGVSGNDSLPIGFSLLRSMDNDLILRASQDTVSPTPHLVSGFGRISGDLNSVETPVLGMEPKTYDAKLLIASGTWNSSGIAPSVNINHIDFGANVFANAALSDTVDGNLSVIPEPRSALLMILVLGLSIVGKLVCQKHK